VRKELETDNLGQEWRIRGRMGKRSLLSFMKERNLLLIRYFHELLREKPSILFMLLG
jgi:hypothetical protein